MHIGIDIGSTATKVAIFRDDILETFVEPTGWSGAETAGRIKEHLVQKGIDVEEAVVVATGYGRVSVPYANKCVTEITCHAKGAVYLFNNDATIIDIGGQDTKVINLKKGMVTDFMMNDKCSAGTGKFIEIMATRLSVDIPKMCELARDGKNLKISSMCTVFAESEIISYIGRGESKEDIANAIIDSILEKVKSLVIKQGGDFDYYLTGGLCCEKYILDGLSQKLGREVRTSDKARFAGAIGAAIHAKKIK